MKSITKSTPISTLPVAKATRERKSQAEFTFTVKSQTDNEKDTMHYFKTINAICNTIRAWGWDTEVYFSDTKDVTITLNRK